ncbi:MULTISPECIES: chaperone modulator CbpM [Salinimicrobium]|uniref:chaperone modulator CbpM n=1 Tax=Salinimicrobium TaxID=561367 RepID=UPI001E3D4154|nr:MULTISPECIES: chaperone modulator CbpM [Salinimicrobium]MCC8360135.1 chaperone modulator CbpM [Salinimicrobium sediminilitoris]MCY2688751.1 chaperone modulator CbpM [Salinimicrobium sp. TH3]
MDDRYISIIEFCNWHQLEVSFIHTLREHDLIQTVVIEEDEYIEQEKLQDLERIMRLHYDLEINLEGIDAINHLLDRVSQLQQEVRILQNKLRRFEE